MHKIRNELIANLVQTPLNTFEEVGKAYPFKLSTFLADRLQQGTYSLPAARQFIPDIRELDVVAGLGFDSCNENADKAIPAVIRTYSNRLAVLITQHCLVYCRFCFRKDFVGQLDTTIADSELNKAIEYVASHREYKDILMTGGDPLAIPNSRLIPFLERMAQIDHLKVIRIHSRAVSVLPDRIDTDLLTFLEGHDCFWYYAHMNHPDDIDHPEVIGAIKRLQKANVPVLNQCVLLDGINSDPSVLCDLLMRCYEAKVIPYNLYVLDEVSGTGHFAVQTKDILRICHEISKLPGPAQPAIVAVDCHNMKRRWTSDQVSELERFLEARTSHHPRGRTGESRNL